MAWATAHTDPLEVREEETELCHLGVAATRAQGTLRAGSIAETEPLSWWECGPAPPETRKHFERTSQGSRGFNDICDGLSGEQRGSLGVSVYLGYVWLPGGCLGYLGVSELSGCLNCVGVSKLSRESVFCGGWVIWGCLGYWWGSGYLGIV